MTGLTLDQLRGMAAVDPYWSFVDEAGAPLAPAHFPVARVSASGKPVPDLVIGFRHPGRPGPTWVLVDAYPFRDDSGQIIAMGQPGPSTRRRHHPDP